MNVRKAQVMCVHMARGTWNPTTRAIRDYSVTRHFSIMRSSILRTDTLVSLGWPMDMAEHSGDLTFLMESFTKQVNCLHECIRTSPSAGSERPNFLLNSAGDFAVPEIAGISSLQLKVLDHFKFIGCATTSDIDILFSDPQYAHFIKSRSSSKNGKHHR